MSEELIDSAETAGLLMRIRNGERELFELLFARRREQLRRAIELRLTPELRARFDASDVVQETHLEAFRRLDDYWFRKPMPFSIWIRKTAQQRLQKLKQQHVQAKLRSVRREQLLPRESSVMIASCLASSGTSVTQRLAAQEFAGLVQEAVGELEELDREILLMRIVEDLAHADIARIVEMNTDAVRQRYGRALIKLRALLVAKGLSRWQS
ncbi:MAG: sigma-70 family RNA polymerase sigma factor [Pirellulaceae bacterium]